MKPQPSAWTRTGTPPDPGLRDTEYVPLSESVDAFFQREVKPHMPEGCINGAIRDEKDGEVGKVGYEINFNRYPPPPRRDSGRYQGRKAGDHGHAAEMVE